MISRKKLRQFWESKAERKQHAAAFKTWFKLARKARLIELEARYVDVIVRRWQDFTGKKAVLESDGRTFADVEGELTRGEPKLRS